MNMFIFTQALEDLPPNALLVIAFLIILGIVLRSICVTIAILARELRITIAAFWGFIEHVIIAFLNFILSLKEKEFLPSLKENEPSNHPRNIPTSPEKAPKEPESNSPCNYSQSDSFASDYLTQGTKQFARIVRNLFSKFLTNS